MFENTRGAYRDCAVHSTLWNDPLGRPSFHYPWLSLRYKCLKTYAGPMHEVPYTQLCETFQWWNHLSPNLRLHLEVFEIPGGFIRESAIILNPVKEHLGKTTFHSTSGITKLQVLENACGALGDSAICSTLWKTNFCYTKSELFENPCGTTPKLPRTQPCETTVWCFHL